MKSNNSSLLSSECFFTDCKGRDNNELISTITLLYNLGFFYVVCVCVWCAAEESVAVTLGAEELVRCSAHFGRSRRHTIFLFVLPSFIKKLAAISERFAQMQGGLIAMFISALSSSQMSRLVHLFWSMGRHSMFGQLFTEVDQKSALALLANIKPAIMDKIPEKYKDIIASPSMDTLVADPRLVSSSSVSSASLGSKSQTLVPCVPHRGSQESQVEKAENLRSRMSSLRMFLQKQKEGDTWSATRLSPGQSDGDSVLRPPETDPTDNCTLNELRDMFRSITERLKINEGSIRTDDDKKAAPTGMGKDASVDSTYTPQSPPTVTGSVDQEAEEGMQVASSSSQPEDADLPIDLSSSDKHLPETEPQSVEIPEFVALFVVQLRCSSA